MKKIALSLAAALLATTAVAGGNDFEVRGGFASLSASGIVAELPRNASVFTALAGQMNGLTVTIKNNMLDVDTMSGSLMEVDGWRNNHGGFIGAGGFAGVKGMFEAD